MSKSNVKFIVLIASMAVFFLGIIPLMCDSYGGVESSRFIIRAYNMMEFSGWGFIPVITPIFVAFTVCGSMKKQLKELMLSIILCVFGVSYIEGYIAAREWMREAIGSAALQPGFVIYPFVLVLFIIAAWVLTVKCSKVRKTVKLKAIE